MTFRTPVLVAAAASALLASGLASALQEQEDTMQPSQSTGQSTQPGQQGMQPPAASQGEPISDEKIEKFADAYISVQTIQQKASQDLQSAATPEEADKVKTAAESEMVAAVERSGLEVPEFNRIVETMASDANVRSRVAAKLQERMGQGQQPPQQ
ncbi:MAG TPA: DUF4168 domain-containing protein [Steroidobacter sp.]